MRKVLFLLLPLLSFGHLAMASLENEVIESMAVLTYPEHDLVAYLDKVDYALEKGEELVTKRLEGLSSEKVDELFGPAWKAFKFRYPEYSKLIGVSEDKTLKENLLAFFSEEAKTELRYKLIEDIEKAGGVEAYTANLRNRIGYVVDRMVDPGTQKVVGVGLFIFIFFSIFGPWLAPLLLPIIIIGLLQTGALALLDKLQELIGL